MQSNVKTNKQRKNIRCLLPSVCETEDGYMDQKMSPELTKWWGADGWNLHFEWPTPLSNSKLIAPPLLSQLYPLQSSMMFKQMLQYRLPTLTTYWGGLGSAPRGQFALRDSWGFSAINKNKTAAHLCPASIWRRPPWCRWPLGPRCTCCGCGSWAARPDSDWLPRSSSAAPVLSAPPPNEWPEDFSEQKSQINKFQMYRHWNALGNINIQASRCFNQTSSTCLSRAIDSLGMISFRPRREIKHRAWYWFCPRSSSPRIRARKIFTSCKTFIMNRWADNSQRALKAVRIRQLFIYRYAFREYRQYSFYFCTVLNAVLFQTL